MDRETARQEIRYRIKCADHLQKSKSGLYCCPYCGSGTGPNGTGAVKYYEGTNSFYCFACHRGGDVIDIYQQIHGVDFPTAITALAQEIGIILDDSATSRVKLSEPHFNGQGNTNPRPEGKMQQNAEKQAKTETSDYSAYYEVCRGNLTGPEGEAARQYLDKRGVLGPAIFYGAGFDPLADPAGAPGAMGSEYRPHPCPRIIIPCSPGHYVARSIDPETPKQYAKMNPSISKGAAAPAIFNAEVLKVQEVQEVFITEGIFDALSIITAGANAIALNSTSNAARLIADLEKNPTAATMIICLDNDRAGQQATEVLEEGLARLHIPYLSADINNGQHDPNDALTADYYGFYEAVQDAIAEARANKEKQLEKAQQAARERQQRTGTGMVDDFLATIKSRKYEPIPTGITDIDRAIGGGFIRQQLVLLGAAPGAGKTALAQWIFEGMAKRGTTCLYLNLEMSREQMLARSISRIAAQAGDRIKTTDILQGYKWTAEQEEAISIAADKYRKEIAWYMIYNPPGVSADLDSILEYIETEAQLAEAANLPAPVVVLDYLQIVTGKDREDDTAVIKRAVASLKRYAIQHNTVVFLIIAHNRAANRSGDVTMEAGRDTSALEYSADLQLGLAYTYCMEKNGGLAKEDLTPEQRCCLTLRVTKARFGGTGTDVDLHFDGETMTYTQTTTRAEEPPTTAGNRYNWANAERL